MGSGIVVLVGGGGVSVGGGGVSVGGGGVSVGGLGVSVGGLGVSVGGAGVFVGGTGVRVGVAVTRVAVGVRIVVALGIGDHVGVVVGVTVAAVAPIGVGVTVAAVVWVGVAVNKGKGGGVSTGAAVGGRIGVAVSTITGAAVGVGFVIVERGRANARPPAIRMITPVSAPRMGSKGNPRRVAGVAVGATAAPDVNAEAERTSRGTGAWLVTRVASWLTTGGDVCPRACVAAGSSGEDGTWAVIGAGRRDVGGKTDGAPGWLLRVEMPGAGDLPAPGRGLCEPGAAPG